jgi:hypothetical protein
MTEIPHLFEPYDYQRPIFRAWQRGVKRGILIWHRKAGKDLTCWNLLLREAFQTPGMYWYVFPEYGQGKTVIWEGFEENGLRFLDHIPPGLATFNKSELQITLANQSVIMIIGSDRYDKMRGPNPRGVIMSEYAYQHPRAWEVIQPILIKNNGWVIFNTTPNGKNHAYDLFTAALANPDTWYSSHQTISDTGLISLDKIDQIRAEGTPEEMIQQEYFCSWEGSVHGSYYGRILAQVRKDGRVCFVPFESRRPVDTFWDLGVGDSTAIWFVQQVGFEVRLIDYYEASGEGLLHYIKLLKEKQYVYGTHNAPFDIEDRELLTGKSRLETARSLGLRFQVVPKLSVDDGIDAVRNLLSQCWFDQAKCRGGLRALDSYHKEWDERHQVFRNKPCHDWSSDGADAFRYLAVGLRKKQRDGIIRRRPPPVTTGGRTSRRITGL